MSSPAELVIRAVTPFITTFSVPFSRFGVIPVGGRSTAVKLNNGDVFVIVSSPCDEPTRGAIDAMGTVKYLLTPDYVHALHISAFHKAYPEAKCIGPEGIDSKKTDVKWTGVFGKGGESITYGFEDEIKIHYFPGHANKEIVALFTPLSTPGQGTLIEADLIFNLPPNEQYSKTKQSPKAWFPASIIQGSMKVPHEGLSKMTGKDKAAMGRDAKIVAAWDFERIIPCHGDVIEGPAAKQTWLDVFKQFM